MTLGSGAMSPARTSGQSKTLLVLGDLYLERRHHQRLESLVGKVSTYEGDDEDRARRGLRQADYVFCCNYSLRPFMADLEGLELLVLAETGIVQLDPVAAQEAGVPLTNLPTYSAPACAQYIMRCVLESIRPWDGVFSPATQGERSEKIGVGLETQTIGLIGFGEIGRQVAEAGHAMGASILANTRRSFRHPFVRWVPRESLFDRADIVVVCCQHNEDSTSMIDGDLLRRMPDRGALVSISHRDVFHLPDLVATLGERPGMRAWLDFDPRDGDEVLASLPNVKVSPHLAFFTRQTLTDRIDGCIDRLEAFVGGRAWRAVIENRRPLETADHRWQEPAEERMLRLASSFYISGAIFAALELGLFDAFDTGAETVSGLAESLKVDPWMLAGLLEALASMGVVERESEGTYVLPSQWAPILHRDSPRYYGHTLLALKRAAYPTWEKAATAVKEGRPVKLLQAQRAGAVADARDLTLGSDSQSRMVARFAVEHLRLLPGQKILDLGCGSAALTRRLLAEEPRSEALLVDVPAVLETTHGMLESEGLADRCRVVAGDYFDQAAFREPVDLVLVSNILHMETEARARSLLARAAAALREGGRLAILGFFRNPAGPQDFLVPHFSLSCQLLTDGGRCPTSSDLSVWLEEAGFASVRSVFLTRYVDLVIGEEQGPTPGAGA